MTKKKNFNILSIFLYTVLALLVVLVLSLLVTKMSNRIPSIFGYSCIRIVSPSMEPKIPTGGYILLKKTDPAKIEVGDIITFYSSDDSIRGLPNTHRVIEIVEQDGKRNFRTKGDRNEVEDMALVQDDFLIGKYQTDLPFLSKAGALLQNKSAFLLCIIVPSAVFLLWELVNVAKKSKEVNEERLKEERIAHLTQEAISQQKEKEKERERDDTL